MDGEGHFSGNKTTITVESTSKTTIEELYRILGGKCTVLKRKTNANRPVFRWRVHGDSARNVCSLLLPFLIEKKKQAEIISILNKFPIRSAMRDSLLERLSELKRMV
tara:strand:- start:672 stop:992 length:321 start_codon:yes stop_codon:yes gene_type:complete